MKYGLALLGMLLIVFGAIFFNTPTQLPTAVDGQEIVLMYKLQALAPKQIAVGAMVIGLILIGIAAMMPTRKVNIPNAPYEQYRARLSAGKKKTTK